MAERLSYEETKTVELPHWPFRQRQLRRYAAALTIGYKDLQNVHVRNRAQLTMLAASVESLDRLEQTRQKLQTTVDDIQADARGISRTPGQEEIHFSEETKE